MYKPTPPLSSGKSSTQKYISPKTNKLLKSNHVSTKSSSKTTPPESIKNSKPESANSLNKSEEFEIPRTKSFDEGILFEVQNIEPAPGTTYHQLVVYAPLETPNSKQQIARKNGAVVLREWPRLRYSQKYTRDGGPNPSEIMYSYDDFLESVEKATKKNSLNKQNSLTAISECSSQMMEKQKQEWTNVNQSLHNINIKERIVHIYGIRNFDEIIKNVNIGKVMYEKMELKKKVVPDY